jgi:hypothetical protein
MFAPPSEVFERQSKGGTMPWSPNIAHCNVESILGVHSFRTACCSICPHVSLLESLRVTADDRLKV